MTDITDLFVALFDRVGSLERRTTGQNWRGKVSHVDPKKGTARIILGQDEDGNDVLSPWTPYAQTAGALKVHTPPTVGQQMEMQGQGGDMESASLRPLHWWNDNKAPSEKGDENVLTFGHFKAELRGDDMMLTMGSGTIRMRPAGINIVFGGSEIVLTSTAIGIKAPSTVLIESNQLIHNAKNVGDTHTNAGLLVD